MIKTKSMDLVIYTISCFGNWKLWKSFLFSV
jgi:hypothetical protein